MIQYGKSCKYGFKVNHLFICGFILLLSCAVANATAVTYPLPSGLPSGDASLVYSLTVNGTAAGVYSGSGGVSYTTFSTDSPVSVTVTLVGTNISSAVVKPASYNVIPQVSGQTATFTMYPYQKVSVELNGNSTTPLLIAADPLEVNPPTQGSSSIAYYGPGFYDLGSSWCFTGGKTEIYIAGGAYLKGVIDCGTVSGLTIAGRGVFSGEGYSGAADSFAGCCTIWFDEGSNITLDGISLTNFYEYGLVLDGSHTVGVTNSNVVNNVMLINTTNNHSGMHQIGNNSTAQNSLVWAGDDAIIIADGTSNSVFKNIVIATTGGDAIQFGWNTGGSGDSATAIDIIHFGGKNYDGTQAAIGSVQYCNTTPIQQVAVNDVRVEGPIYRLFGLSTGPESNFCSINSGFAPISNVTITNVDAEQVASSQSIIRGHDSNSAIQNVSFNNLTVNGVQVTSSNSASSSGGNFDVGSNSSNITFNAPGPNIANPSFEAPALGTSTTSYQYQPGQPGWSFDVNAGIQANGSAWLYNGGSNTSNGLQAAFLQSNSCTSEPVSNFTAGTTYSVTFSAAQRGNNQGGQSIQVFFDTTSLGTFTPASTGYADIISNSVTPSSGGTHTIKFCGTVSGINHTAFIDNVRLSSSTGVTQQASNGFPWQYQYSTDGENSFQYMTWDNADAAWVGPGGYSNYCAVWSNRQHPSGSTCDAARVWVAPSAGTASIGANGNITVAAACGGNNSGVNIRILKNSTQIWPASGWLTLAHGASFSFPSGITTSVNAGDKIEFVIAHTGSDNACDSTIWDQVVTMGNNYQASSGFGWLYQYSTDGENSFQGMSWDGTNAAWVGPGGFSTYCVVWSSRQHPSGSTCDAGRVWVAPTAGTATLGANGNITVMASCGGNNSGVNIKILKNNAQIWPSSGWESLAHGSSFAFPSGVATSVNAGDNIQFVISHTGTDNLCDASTWDQTVTF